MFQYLRIMPHSYSYRNHLHCFDRSHSQQPSTSILMENITKKTRAFWVLTVDFLPGTPNSPTLFKWMMIYDFQKKNICKDLRFIIQLKTPTHYKWMAIRFQVKLQVNLSENKCLTELDARLRLHPTVWPKSLYISKVQFFKEITNGFNVAFQPRKLDRRKWWIHVRRCVLVVNLLVGKKQRKNATFQWASFKQH